jgi:subtilisin-like proprotein convertase family protein
LDTVIGDANYDIGHLFNQQDNALDGNAGFVGAVCRSGRKGSAYSTLSAPEGEAFAIDLVAHEMGHQLGANHTFSHFSEGTQAQVEPGSGTTIMGYAGITNENDVAEMSDDYFHYVSIVQISDYLETVSCGEVINLVNTPPSLTATSDYTIPKGTAFILDGTALDTDKADILTYTWEQTNAAVVTQATFGPTNPVGALFRSLPPTTVSYRYFPKLERITSGNLTQVNPSSGDAWETVSLVERELNFALTVRDNSIEAGQLATDEVAVFVTNEAGPFIVTSQDAATSYVAGEVQLISWDVANTNIAPVSAETVDIFLSTDGGQSFPITIAENILNDGSHEFIVPALPTTNARLMVKASNTIFLAVNTVDFSIVASEVVLNFTQLDYEVCQPDDLTVNFTYETYLGFNAESTFSATGLPPGLNVTFSNPTAIDTNTPISITFTGSDNLAVGTYPLQIIATASGLVKEVPINVTVYDTNFESIVPIFPLNEAIDVSKDLTLEWEDNDRNTSYDIEIATDVAFTTIVEAVSITNTFYTPNNLENGASYFWRVKPKNNCADGVFGVPFRFTTILINCDTKSAFNLPLEISSVATPVITSKIVFYEDLPISDINVSLNVEHTFLSDLQISLTSPEGTTVVLVSSSCDASRNINAVFDDQASPFVCAGNPGIGGTVAPLGSLSSFNGESLLGEWILEIKDNVADDGGRLNSFSLDVCIEGDFRPDADNDGIFDDGEDSCLDTPDGQEVDASGCAIYRFTNQNFNISLESETCRANNDGKFTITPKVGLSYEITVSGPDTNLTQGFTNIFTLADLSAGAYDLCITGTDGTIVYETFCSQVVITEPDILDVSAITSLDGSKLTVNLDGSDTYNIELNGIVLQTQEPTVTLDLVSGVNTLKVYTDIPCQGSYIEQFVRSDAPLVYPNPFEDSISVYFGNPGSTISLKIFTSDGRLIQNMMAEVEADGTQIDLEALSSGLYFVQFSGNGVSGTAKIIKK